MGDEKERPHWTSEDYYTANLPANSTHALADILSRIRSLEQEYVASRDPGDITLKIWEGVLAAREFQRQKGVLEWLKLPEFREMHETSEGEPDTDTRTANDRYGSPTSLLFFKITELLKTIYKSEDGDFVAAHLSRLGRYYSGAFETSRYELEDAEIKRIRALINELRDLVDASKDFEQKHRQRILSRIEKLNAEVSNKMSNLDRFWGLIGDAGVAVGKFGTNAKPFVDLIREIAEIIWKVQARDAELPEPGGLPQLGGSEEGESADRA